MTIGSFHFSDVQSKGDLKELGRLIVDGELVQATNSTISWQQEALQQRQHPASLALKVCDCTQTSAPNSFSFAMVMGRLTDKIRQASPRISFSLTWSGEGGM